MSGRNEDMICPNNIQLQYLNRIKYESDKFISWFTSSAENLFKSRRTKNLLLRFTGPPSKVYV